MSASDFSLDCVVLNCISFAAFTTLSKLSVLPLREVNPVCSDKPCVFSLLEHVRKETVCFYKDLWVQRRIDFARYS
jgi:hypothetical protein